jgi:hypothetical protein
LERLAHVEFFAAGCEEGWRIAPPTLAAHSVSSGVRGVLCGARSPALRERIVLAAEKLSCEVLDLPDIPEVIRIVAPEIRALTEVASQSNLHLQQDAPLAILSNLPPCSPPSRNHKGAEFPQGADWSIHEFDVTTLEWRRVERRETQAVRFGVLRFGIHFQRPRFFLCWKGIPFEMPRALALYALLRRNRRTVVRYNREACTFSLPPICRPPRLLERAFVLCSGLPPSYDAAQVTYSAVTPEIARFAAELLRQPLA